MLKWLESWTEEADCQVLNLISTTYKVGASY